MVRETQKITALLGVNISMGMACALQSSAEMRKNMINRKGISGLLVMDIAAMAVLYLMPDSWGDWQVKKILIIFMAVAAVVLVVLLSGKKEKETHVQVTGIDPVSQMNPVQYLTKGGSVCAGSDGRYHVTFLLKDDTSLILSLSGKQAGTLETGMSGTLVHNGSVFISFIPK